MRFGSNFGVTQIVIGLHRVGLVGFRKALKDAAASGQTDREAIVDLIIEALVAQNYIPDRKFQPLRTALWREYLRSRGEDYSQFYSEVEVVIRGDPGPERERFADLTQSVFAGFELKPVIIYEPPSAEGPNPQLVVRGKAIVAGALDQRRFHAAVRHSFTDW
jgi:hypothetical protein